DSPGGELGDDPDPEAAWRDDAQLRVVSEDADEREPVPGGERVLELRSARELRGRARDAVELLAVDAERGAEPGREARVDEPRLAARGHAGETPEQRGKRKQREQQEIPDELDLEAREAILAQGST